MLMENCDALASAMFEKMKTTVDDEKGHYALHVMDEMLKPMPNMRFIIGADLSKTFDLYALIEHCDMLDMYRQANTKRIMYRLIHLYMKGNPQQEDTLRDLIFNLGIEEE